MVVFTVKSLMLRDGQFWQGGLAETAVVCLVVLAAVSARPPAKTGRRVTSVISP
jgi:hypothetical protein